MDFQIDYTNYDPDKAYCGVGKFKLPASHIFNRAGFAHDQLYENWLCENTKPIDLFFWEKCRIEAWDLYRQDRILHKDLLELYRESERLYKITRMWGTGRYAYAKLRGWKYLLRAE